MGFSLCLVVLACLLGAAPPPSPDVAPAVNLAQALAAKGQTARARRLLSAALAQAPDDVWASYDLGVLLQQQGHLEQAEQLYQAALRQAAQLTLPTAGTLGARLHNNLGVLYVRQGRWEAARQAFSQASVLQPSDADSWFNAGLLALQLGEEPTALRQFNQVLRLLPQHAAARRYSAEIYLRRGALFEAAEDYGQLP